MRESVNRKCLQVSCPTGARMDAGSAAPSLESARKLVLSCFSYGFLVKTCHSDRGCLGRIIKAAAEAEVEILEAAPTDIIMVSLWFLFVKRKLRKSLKK